MPQRRSISSLAKRLTVDSSSSSAEGTTNFSEHALQRALRPAASSGSFSARAQEGQSIVISMGKARKKEVWTPVRPDPKLDAAEANPKR